MAKTIDRTIIIYTECVKCDKMFIKWKGCKGYCRECSITHAKTIK
jgi:hypothetical protein